MPPSIRPQISTMPPIEVKKWCDIVLSCGSSVQNKMQVQEVTGLCQLSSHVMRQCNIRILPKSCVLILCFFGSRSFSVAKCPTASLNLGKAVKSASRGLPTIDLVQIPQGRVTSRKLHGKKPKRTATKSTWMICEKSGHWRSHGCVVGNGYSRG